LLLLLAPTGPCLLLLVDPGMSQWLLLLLLLLLLHLLLLRSHVAGNIISAELICQTPHELVHSLLQLIP
jgi:hypothetical protein